MDLPFNGGPKKLGSTSGPPSPTPSDADTRSKWCCGKSSCCSQVPVAVKCSTWHKSILFLKWAFPVLFSDLFFLFLGTLVDTTKQERRRRFCSKHCSLTCYLKKSDAQQEEIDNNSEPEKLKSITGFEPGLLGQNAIGQSLAPPHCLFRKCTYWTF